MSDRPSFFSELKRRNVLRAAAFYAASAWLLVQVATQVFPFFHIAEWVVRWIVVAACIGFPFALVFSWSYEWTPQGLQRESEIAPNESITGQTGKRLDRWIIAILALAVVLLLADKLVLHKDANAGSDKAAPASSGKSIAVLPLVNQSGDPSQEYFSDGLSDELINGLGQIHELRVIGRNSSFHFKGKSDDSRAVGQALGVANLLEGSVRKAGDRVRISVALVDAANGSQRWSQTYDRELKDIFAVQEEIARSVADQLRITLLGGEVTASGRPSNGSLEAYDAYLKGQQLQQIGECRRLRQSDRISRRGDSSRSSLCRGLCLQITRLDWDRYLPWRERNGRVRAGADRG